MEHERWLEQIARQADFEVEDWEALTAQTLVTKMPDYETGRALFDVYRPNPLLSEEGGTEDEPLVFHLGGL